MGLVINIDKIKVLLKSMKLKLEIKLDETVLEMADDFLVLERMVK